MAITTHGLITIALLLTTVVLETVHFSGAVLDVHSEEENFVSPVREKRSAPLPVYEYVVSIELITTDVAVIDLLKSIRFPISITGAILVSDLNISTVCYPNSTGYQCRCEDQYRWSCDQCFMYGACDNITADTCGCISDIPPDGQHCLSADQHNFPSCPSTTISPSPTTPLPVYEYVVSIELTTTDVAVIDLLKSIRFPISITGAILVSDLNISTVCYPNSTGYQCRCEDQYRWSCDQCFMYGACDNITADTCGCISDIPPDGQHCLSADQHNFPSCPSTTVSPSPTTPLPVYEYVVSIELTTTDVAVIDLLKSIRFPISITGAILVSDLNISTVCYPNSTGYQCRCEDQYRWSCDQCFMYGACDNITADTCGCISDIPPDGQHCLSADQHNFRACPTTTTTELASSTTAFNTTSTTNTTDSTTPVSTPTTFVTNSTTAFNTTSTTNTTDSTTPVSTPTTFVTNSTTAFNTTSTTNPTDSTTPVSTPTTFVTNSTTAFNTTSTTNPTDSTTPVSTPTTFVTNSTTGFNTTSTTNTTDSTTPVSTPTTFVTNSTTGFNTTSTTNTTDSTTPVSTPTTFVTNSTTAFNTTSTTNTTDSTTPVSTPTTFVTNSTTAFNTRPTTNTIVSLTAFNTTPTTNTTGLNVEMSIELDTTFNNNLNNKLSDEYKTLESRINRVLVNQYAEITGFLGVSVTGFSEGSVITEFTVQTTNIIVDEVAAANEELVNAMEAIAPVIGSVTATFNSNIPVKLINPAAIFTGQTIQLMCEVSDDLNIEEISGSIWKFNEREINTNQILFSGSTSILKVNNVVLLDIGIYECTLTGGIISYSQKRAITNIEQAPIIRLKRQVNVKCETGDGEVKSIECCVQSPYTVNWFSGSEVLPHDPPTSDGCIKYNYPLSSCSQPPVFTCKVDQQNYEDRTEITIFTEDVACRDPVYGDGREGDISTIECDPSLQGFKRARCESTKWILLEDTCIVTRVQQLLFASERLNEETVAEFATNLSIAVRDEQTNILGSPETISAIVDILKNIAAHIGEVVSVDVLEDVLRTVDVIIGDDARESWATLNANETRNASSSLLGSMELLAGGLVGEVAVATQRILLNRTSFNNSFRADLGSSIFIDIADINLPNVFITTITFFTLNNVMPVRNSSSIFNTTSNASRVVDTAVNAAVVLVQINETIQNVTLRYRKLNETLSRDAQCVFWNFTLFNDLGAWDNKGCVFVSDINNTVTCNCNHLTSFSILMATDIPSAIGFALDVITYVGVGISLASLVICLIIEGYVWKAMTKNSTSFMRHVSIVNSAVSLLIANICFIIGASIADNPLEDPGGNHLVPVGACSTATFFMHFFYLALFFWMLVSGLLLFYRTVMVFSDASKATMLGIGFALGYGCPLIIAVITVAVTAPENGYIRKYDACWLNWMETRALLAMVIPALTIVSINILIVFVVVFKILRRGVGDTAQADERHTVVVILRCVVILTPLFGLTWALGVGTIIDSKNTGIHIAFAFFNSLQGFFILVFGTLFDSRVRSMLSSRGSSHTSGTSGGLSSQSGLNWINRLRRKRNVYHVSDAATSSSTGASESFMSI
ncbi:adhesion G protein-coupled receptor F5-like isoform 10-T10 [Spinachia spinachia]